MILLRATFRICSLAAKGGVVEGDLPKTVAASVKCRAKNRQFVFQNLPRDCTGSRLSFLHDEQSQRRLVSLRSDFSSAKESKNFQKQKFKTKNKNKIMSTPKSLSNAIAKAEGLLPPKAKGKKKSTGRKVLSTVGKVASAVESLAPLLALAPAVLARHPAYAGHPQLKTQLASAPATFGGITQTTTNFTASMKKDRLIVSSTDVIGEVKWVLASEPFRAIGSSIFAVSIDPYSPAFKGTRVQLLARAYQQWTIKRANFIFVPMAPTTAVGALVMMTTSDPDEMIQETGLLAVKAVMSHVGASEFPLWLPASCSYVPVPGREFYSSALNGAINEPPDAIEVGLEARQTSAGQIAIFSASDLYPFSDGINSFTTYGQVLVDWELEFFNPVAEDLKDTLWFGKAINSTGGSLVTNTEPLGPPTQRDFGWGYWDRVVPWVGTQFPETDMAITLGAEGRVHGFPVGFYFGWMYIANVTGSMSPQGSTSLKDSIVVMSNGFTLNSASTQATRWVFFSVVQSGDATIQDFNPFPWIVAPTAIGNDDFRLAFARIASFNNFLDQGSPLGDGLIMQRRQKRRREAFRAAVLRAMSPYLLSELTPQPTATTQPVVAPSEPQSMVSTSDLAALMSLLNAPRPSGYPALSMQ